MFQTQEYSRKVLLAFSLFHLADISVFLVFAFTLSSQLVSLTSQKAASSVWALVVLKVEKWKFYVEMPLAFDSKNVSNRRLSSSIRLRSLLRLLHLPREILSSRPSSKWERVLFGFVVLASTYEQRCKWWLTLHCSGDWLLVIVRLVFGLVLLAAESLHR